MKLKILFFRRLSASLDVSELSRKGVLNNRTTLSVNVTATDNGEPRLSNMIELIINIIDINEENPRFNSTFYHVNFTENSAEGNFVVKVTAVKNSLSSRLTYSFTTNKEEFFNIDEKTVCFIQPISSGN